MKNTTWNTYRTSGYTHDVANDQRSAGGVHHHQVRRTASGWQTRILQANGRHRASGPITSVAETEGLAFYAAAKKY